MKLIGYAQGQLGIGEDLRCTAAALDAAGIPTAILNFPPGRNVPQSDHTLTDRLAEQGRYAFNLFSLTAEEIARWPGPWLRLFGLVDELWASSEHTLAAMQQGLAAPNKAVPKPLLSTELMPLAVTLPLVASGNRLQTRTAYGLPAQAVHLCLRSPLLDSRQEPPHGLADQNPPAPSPTPCVISWCA